MKVYIGPPTDRLICDLHARFMNRRYGYLGWHSSVTLFEKFLEWLEDKIQSFYNIFNWIWFDRRKQKIKVRIDEWDTWGMDYTLTLLIIPMLKQLQATKHGSANVDIEDTPKHLHPPEDKRDLKVGETDSKFHERWDWVLNELIWTFEQLRDDDWQEKYIKFKDSDNLLNFEIDYKDEIGYNKHQERINNGLRLFGKYYTNLWD